MGFLADFNRSGAYGVGQNLLGQMNQLGQQQIQAEQAKLQNVLAFSKMKSQLDAMAEEEKPFNVKLSPILSAIEPGTPEHEKIYESLRGLSGADEHGNTTIGGYKKGVAGLTINKELMTQIKDARMGQLYEEYEKARQKAFDASLGGDSEGEKKAQIRVDAIKSKIIQGEGKFAEYIISQGKQMPQGDDIKTFVGHATVSIGGKPTVVQPVLQGGKVSNLPIGEAAQERPYSQFVGVPPEGQAVTFNTRTNRFDLQPLPGPLQPKIAPTIPTEQTTALQQVGTLKEALGQVTDMYEDSFVGPVAGPTGKIADNWGIMPNSKR